ncbi:MAG: hypothetical protein U0Q16_08205 [Bryobacteraceae bacterium]
MTVALWTRRRALAAPLAWLAPAMAADSKQERGRQALDATVEALGGAKFKAMEDRVESGRAYSFYNSKLSGLARATIYTRYLTPPAKPDPTQVYSRERQAFGKDETWAVLFTEDKGFTLTYRGAQPVPQAQLDRYRDTTRRNIFYILKQRLNEPGLIVEHQGKDVFDNQGVDVVDITDSENVTVTVFLNQTTHLPVRQMFYRRDPVTRDRNEEVTIFAKYRDTSGLQWPWAITRHRNGEKIFELFSDSVSINKDLNDSRFTLPANMKVLPPPR